MGNDSLLKFAEFLNTPAVDTRNDVTALYASFVSGTVRCYLIYVYSGYRSKVNLLTFLLLHVDIGADICTSNSKQCTLNKAEIADILHHFVHDGCGDCEAIS